MGGVDVVDLEEEPDSPGDLVADRTGLVVAVGAGSANRSRMLPAPVPRTWRA